jgi:hypothetical protein
MILNTRVKYKVCIFSCKKKKKKYSNVLNYVINTMKIYGEKHIRNII